MDLLVKYDRDIGASYALREKLLNDYKVIRAETRNIEVGKCLRSRMIYVVQFQSTAVTAYFAPGAVDRATTAICTIQERARDCADESLYRETRIL